MILGMDLTNSTSLDAVWPFVSNTEAIGVNQAWNGEPGQLRWSGFQPYYDVVTKRLGRSAGGLPEVAVLVVNKDLSDLSVKLPLQLFGLSTAGTYTVRDIWNHEDVGTLSIGPGGANSTWAVEKVPAQ